MCLDGEKRQSQVAYLKISSDVNRELVALLHVLVPELLCDVEVFARSIQRHFIHVGVLYPIR